MMRSPRLDTLRQRTLVITAVAAIASFGLMLHVGKYRMDLLMLLFAGWDLAPFAALVTAGVVSKRWPALVRGALYVVTLLVAMASVGVYALVVLKRPAQPAFAFLTVPLASWAISIVVVLVAHTVSTKRIVSRRKSSGSLARSG